MSSQQEFSSQQTPSPPSPPKPPPPQFAAERGTRDREVFRSPGSLVLSGAWLLVAVLVLADLAVQGRDHTAATTAALVIAITGVVYACAWRPRIVADGNGVTLTNPIRDHWVPWGAVAKVDVANAVRVHCLPVAASAHGKVLYSWAMQSSPRSSLRAARREARRAGRGGILGGLERPGAPTAPAGPAGGARGYGRPPDPARELLSRTPAEFAAGQLEERAERARRTGAETGQHVSRWAWASIAAMTLPVAALVVVVLV